MAQVPPPDHEALDAVLARGKPGVIYWPASQPTETYTGGTPNLGEEYSWPEKDGKLLEFIGQVALEPLAELMPDSLLPRNGILSFFYEYRGDQPWGFDPKDRGSWKVEYSEQQLPTPSPVDPITQVFVEPELVTTYASWENRVNIDLPNVFSLLPHWERYMPTFQDAELQVGGFPCPIQSDTMDEQSAMASAGIYIGNGILYDSPEGIAARATASEWILLAQFNSRRSDEMMFGDLGMIYYWIRKQDLAALDFSKTWLILQCS